MDRSFALRLVIWEYLLPTQRRERLAAVLSHYARKKRTYPRTPLGAVLHLRDASILLLRSCGMYVHYRPPRGDEDTPYALLRERRVFYTYRLYALDLALSSAARRDRYWGGYYSPRGSVYLSAF